MKKLIAFALTAICLAAVSVASADNGKKTGPLNAAIHADIVVLFVDGSSKAETADCGRVAALDANAGTLKIDGPDKQSVSFSVSSDTIVRHRGEEKTLPDVSIGDHVLVFASNGQALFIRDAGQPKKAA